MTKKKTNLKNKLAEYSNIKKDKELSDEIFQDSIREVNYLYNQQIEHVQKELLEAKTESSTKISTLNKEIAELKEINKSCEESITNFKNKIKELKYQIEISQKAATYRLEKSEKKFNDMKSLEEENKKLKKDLTSAKTKLRNTSKDRYLYETNLSRNSFASKVSGVYDCKPHSLSRECNNTDRSNILSSKFDAINDNSKVKVSILQSTNDKIVKENAMLRLRLEELERYEENNNIHHNNKLASSIARRELKILKIYQECAEEVKCVCCKVLLPPNRFYSHDCIQNLVDWEEDIDIEK